MSDVDKASNLPYTNFTDVYENDPAFERWSARLVPCKWTDLFDGLHDDEDYIDTFLDSLNGLPVVRWMEDRPRYRAAIPHQYFGREPFQAVLFGEGYNVWLLDGDGQPQLAPEWRTGNSWGYPGGTGCRFFANLLADLLDGSWSGVIESNGVRTPDSGLYAIAIHKWSAGTVLTRTEIAAKRTGTYGFRDE